MQVLLDNGQTLSNKIIDEKDGYAFSRYLVSDVFENPDKQLKLKFELPSSYVKSSKIRYLITSYVNVAVCFETLNHKKAFPNGNKLTLNDLDFYLETVIENGKEYRILNNYTQLNKKKTLKASFISFRDKSRDIEIYSNFEEYAGAIANSIIPDYMNKEFEKIENNIYAYMFDMNNQNGNLYQALFYIENLPDLTRSKLEEPVSFYNSFVGKYPDFNSKLQNQKSDAIQFVSAKKHLKEIYEDYDYLLFNENHADPYCRYFVKTLLPDLVNAGYTNLGIETLSYINHNINENGFPIYGSGFFTDEPNMANLIREAVQLGIHVFPYEEYSYNCDTCKTQLQKRNFRELGQAKNIVENTKLQKGKTIILAGLAHINKHSGRNDFKYMAGYLKELTGDNILSINQTMQKEYTIPSGLGDVISMRKDTGYFVTEKLSNKVDLQILHDPNIKNNNYNLAIGDVCDYDIKVAEKGKGYLSIYNKHEKDLFLKKAIPLACTPINNSESIKIHLDTGSYVILEFDHFGTAINITKLDCQ